MWRLWFKFESFTTILHRCQCVTPSQINSDCSLLVGLLCDVYQKIGIADHPQLNKMDYCIHLSEKLKHHNITDEEVVLFLMTYSGKLNLRKIFDFDENTGDIVDIKFIVFTQKNESSIFLTCERRLLQLCRELKLEHWCFKASIHHLDKQIGGISQEKEFNTSQMFDADGTHPFFHYSKDNRCLECHDTVCLFT